MSKTRDEFVQRWTDELTGLLMASFAESLKVTDWSTNGRMMRHQLLRARDLLQRIHAEDVQATEPLPIKPEATKPVLTNGVHPRKP